LSLRERAEGQRYYRDCHAMHTISTKNSQLCCVTEDCTWHSIR